MNDRVKRYATSLGKLEQWLAYIIILAGLAAWTGIQPPPKHWFPVAALLLAAIAIVVRSVAASRHASSTLRMFRGSDIHPGSIQGNHEIRETNE
jgi:hypothetical protein